MLAKSVVALLLVNSSLAQRDLEALRGSRSKFAGQDSKDQNSENRVGVSDEFKKWRSIEQFNKLHDDAHAKAPVHSEFMIQKRTAPIHPEREPENWSRSLTTDQMIDDEREKDVHTETRDRATKAERRANYESNAKAPARGEFLIQNRTAPIHAKREPENWSRSLTIDQMIDEVRERDVQTKTRTRPTKAERRANYLRSLAEQDIDEDLEEEKHDEHDYPDGHEDHDEHDDHPYEEESGDGEHVASLSLSDDLAIDMMESASNTDSLNGAQDARRGSFDFDKLNIFVEDGENGASFSVSDDLTIGTMDSRRETFVSNELNILSQKESDELKLDFNKVISQENRADGDQQTVLDLDFDKKVSQVKRGLTATTTAATTTTKMTPTIQTTTTPQTATTTEPELNAQTEDQQTVMDLDFDKMVSQVKRRLTTTTTSTTMTTKTTPAIQITTTTPQSATTTELKINTQIESNEIEIDNDESMLTRFSNLMLRKRSKNSRIENYFIQGLISKARVEGMPPKIREAIQSEISGNRAEGSINCLNNPNCDPPITLRGIWQYGCWCNFGADLTTGSGVAVTQYDQKCRSLQLCLRCAAVDGMDGGYECNPLTSTYQVDVSAVLTAPDPSAIIAETCDSDNADDLCAQSLCMCEMELIRSVIDLLWEEVSSEKDVYLHENGFEAGEICVSGQALGGGQQQCCGYYPQRYPFLDQSHLTCCRENSQERIYNALLQSCCPGVGVVNSPSC